MTNFRNLKQSNICFLKYITESAWEMGEKKFMGEVWACACERTHDVSFLIIPMS